MSGCWVRESALASSNLQASASLLPSSDVGEALELPKARWPTGVPHPTPTSLTATRMSLSVLSRSPSSPKPQSPPPAPARARPGGLSEVTGDTPAHLGRRQELRCSEALGRGRRLDSARERRLGSRAWREAQAERAGTAPVSHQHPSGWRQGSSQAPASSCWSGGPRQVL